MKYHGMPQMNEKKVKLFPMATEVEDMCIADGGQMSA